MATSLPVIDIADLVADPRYSSPGQRSRVSSELGSACEQWGFFIVVGHGVDPNLRARLTAHAEAFFDLSATEKAEISMVRGGAAWRGWFGVGEELTSGTPDLKEGIYFGTELSSDDPRVTAGRPLHGPNLFPARPAGMDAVVLEWIDAVTSVGRTVLSGIATHLGLEPDWFDRWCDDPTVLFRIFHYPPGAPSPDRPHDGRTDWGVAEHTDYGLITLLAIEDRPQTPKLGRDQSQAGRSDSGLEVRVDGDWIGVPNVADAFVCNLGDMLDRLTGGRFRSTPHRVRPPVSDRYSFPLFLDPGWDVQIGPIPGAVRSDDRAPDTRWDGADLASMSGTYGDYLTAKVSRVFPALFESSRLDADRRDTNGVRASEQEAADTLDGDG